MKRTEAARINGRKGGRPPGSPNRWSARVRQLEEQALDLVLGNGDSGKAAQRLIKGIFEIAYGKPQGPDGKPMRVSTKERLQARIWLAERRFGHLPQPLKLGDDEDKVTLIVKLHKDAPPA